MDKKIRQRAYDQKFKTKHPEYLSRRAQWNREWIRQNRSRYNRSKWRYRDALKARAIAFYSNGTSKCKWCGFGEIDALCLDHINDDGAADRKRLKIAARGNGSGSRTYEALTARGFPPGYQVLCANCNMIKEVRRRRSLRGKGVIDARPRSYNDTLQLFTEGVPVTILASDGNRIQASR